MKFELRAIIKFLYLRNEKPNRIHEMINETPGYAEVSITTIRKWVKRFKDGEMDIIDSKRSGRPKIKNKFISKVRLMIEENPSLSCKFIAKKLDIGWGTVKKILIEELGLKKVNMKWIPHTLNDDQKAKRKEDSIEILRIIENTPNKELCNLLTGDETWIYYENPRPIVWQRLHHHRPQFPKKTIASKKMMISVIWSCSGIHSITPLQRGQKFNRKFYSGFFSFQFNLIFE